MGRRAKTITLGEQVMTVSVFRYGDAFLARTECVWTFDAEPKRWNPAGLERGATAVEAAGLAIAHVRRIGTHRKRGRKPSGYTVAHQLATRPYVTPK